MQRTLILLRHGKSAYPDGVDDHDRPLAARGRREAPLAGEWLNEHYPTTDLILTSTAKRARQTADIVHNAFTQIPAFESDIRLYLADDEMLMTVVRELPPYQNTVLLVGHNPGLEHLISTVAQTWYPMRTSSIAVLSGAGGWEAVAPGWATLETAVTPRPGK